MKIVIGKRVFNTLKVVSFLLLLAGVTLGLVNIKNTLVQAQDEIVTTSSDSSLDSLKEVLNATDTYYIFTSDDCEFCAELKSELTTAKITNVVYRNIDSEAQYKADFANVLLKCGSENSAVPMIYIDEKCVFGATPISTVIISKETAKAADTTGFIKNTDILVNAPLTSGVSPYALSIVDYIIFGVFFVLLVVVLVLAFKANSQRNEKMRMYAVLAGFVLILGLVGFIGFRVNQAGTLSNLMSSAGKKDKDDGGKKEKNNCIAEGNCKDWNDFVQSKQDDPNIKKSDKDKYKEVDQASLDAQANAIAAAARAGDYMCGAAACTYGQYVDYQSQQVAAGTMTTTQYKTAMYGITSDGSTGGTIVSGSAIGNAITKYNEAQEAQIKAQFAQNIKDREVAGKVTCNVNPNSEECLYYQKQMMATLCPGGSEASAANCYIKDGIDCVKNFNCATGGLKQEIVDKVFSSTFTQVLNPNSGLASYEVNNLTQTGVGSECLVPTSGGPCPPGTTTCVCQTSPVYRATCGTPGQSCSSVCIATHNVCDNCSTTDIPRTEDEPPRCNETCSNASGGLACQTGSCINGVCRNPQCQDDPDCVCTGTAPKCNEACQAAPNDTCTDGTRCTNGICRNPVCPTNASCICTSQPVCGDGIINQSPQAPEQCELNDPVGTSCNWATCNHATCKCPQSNPNWSMVKTHSVACVYPTPSTVAARVTYYISLTYTNTTSPTTPGTIERVKDDPVGVQSSWVVPGSINLGGQIVAGTPNISNFSILWDLVAPQSVFTIPTGQTSVTKTNLLSYQIQIPGRSLNSGANLSEGSYVNLVTAYPSQTTTDGSFTYTDSVYVYCSMGTGLFDSVLAKFALAIFLVLVAVVYFFSDKLDGVMKVAFKSNIAKEVKGLVDADQYVQNKKEDFESRILKERKDSK